MPLLRASFCQLPGQVDGLSLTADQHGKSRRLLWHDADLQLLEIRFLTPVVVHPFVLDGYPCLPSDMTIRAGAGRLFFESL